MHYGQRAVRKLAAEKLYVARSEALNSAGIAQTKARFLSVVLGDAHDAWYHEPGVFNEGVSPSADGDGLIKRSDPAHPNSPQ